MADREKIIADLNGLKELLKFQRDVQGYGMFIDVIDNTVTLLKEQEEVKPYLDFDGHDVWRCGNCGATMFHIYTSTTEEAKDYAKYCRQCGRKVKWK